MQAAGILGFGVLGACSLASDLTPLTDGVCADGEKACNQRCVSTKSTDFGCASSSCAPCALFDAHSICSPNGACAIAGCIGAHQDCDHLAQTGCEVDINHDPKHCGSCQADPCVIKNGIPGCSAGVCAVGGCLPGFGDCNDDPLDGCETDTTSDSKNCGSCMMPCSAGQSCAQGQCM